MELSQVLNGLRDPMGVPFYPWLFQVLMVLTFALHIIFVNLAIGGSFMAVYEHYKKGEFNKKLSRFLARSSTVNLSAAVVLGVAPLLFVQVIYDPFWYVSNVLSAWWAVGFLCFVTGAFLSLYAFYLKRNPDTGMKGFGFFGWVTFGLLLLAGFSMHLLSFQFLEPEKWKAWYLTGTMMNTSGTTVYDFRISRYLHFIIASFAITGVFMMLYGWFFSKRKDMDKEYLHWVALSGAKLALWGTVVAMIMGIWWLFSVPSQFHFAGNPFLLLGVALGVVFLIVLVMAQREPEKYAVVSALFGFLAVLGMSVAREVLRMVYLGKFNYSIYTYKLNINWGSTALFLLTFIMGIVVMAYPLAVAWKLGRYGKSTSEGGA